MTLANIITFLRLLLTPLVAWLYLQDAPLWSSSVFAMAALTDALDGWVARVRGEVSRTGKWLDPVADKALQVVSLLLLTSEGFAPTWLVALLLAKEAGLVIGGLWFLRRGRVFGARFLGKAGSLLLFVALACGLAGFTFARPLLFLGAFLSLMAGLDYLVQASSFSSRKTG